MFHKIISLMVGKREKRGGRSAWTLCSGLPLWIARQNRRAIPVCESYSVLYCAAPAARGAPKRASHALPSPPFSLLSTQRKHTAFFQGKREKRGGRSAWTLCSGLPLWIARQKRRARRAHARQPRTTLSSLLPTLYFHHSQFPRMTIQYTPCRASPVACSASNARKQIITILFATSYNF